MATLEKRITELESATPDEARVLVLLPDENGAHAPVPMGFSGKVVRVDFVAPHDPIDA